jgi:Metallophosphoesterase, calcineurin superfamily
MNTFLICGGTRGERVSLELLKRVVGDRRPDGVLFTGGVLDPRHDFEPHTMTWDLTPADARFVEDFFRTLGGLGVFCAVIPGPDDGPLDKFLRLGMKAEFEFPSLDIVHATLVTAGGVAVCGVGGRVSDGPAYELDLCSQTQAEYVVRPLREARQYRKVLLLSAAPPGPLAGEGGSVVSADLIARCRPGVCVVLGPGDRFGIQRLERTLVVNPGPLCEGRAAWLNWSNPADPLIRLLDLSDTEKSLDAGRAMGRDLAEASS